MEHQAAVTHRSPLAESICTASAFDKRLYGRGGVKLPEYVLDSGSLALAGLHAVTYRSLSEAAEAVRRARRSHAAL